MSGVSNLSNSPSALDLLNKGANRTSTGIGDLFTGMIEAPVELGEHAVKGAEQMAAAPFQEGGSLLKGIGNEIEGKENPNPVSVGQGLGSSPLQTIGTPVSVGQGLGFSPDRTIGSHLTPSPVSPMQGNGPSKPMSTIGTPESGSSRSSTAPQGPRSTNGHVNTWRNELSSETHAASDGLDALGKIAPNSEKVSVFSKGINNLLDKMRGQRIQESGSNGHGMISADTYASQKKEMSLISNLMAKFTGSLHNGRPVLNRQIVQEGEMAGEVKQNGKLGCSSEGLTKKNLDQIKDIKDRGAELSADSGHLTPTQARQQSYLLDQTGDLIAGKFAQSNTNAQA